MSRSNGAIVVDYEELRRMSRVWRDTAETLARQAFSVASMATDGCIFSNAVFDPAGAARVETSIVAAAAVPHGLAALAAHLAADGLALEAVVVKEQLVDDFPLRQLLSLDTVITTATVRFAFEPRQTLRGLESTGTGFAGAMVGYLAPFTEPLLEAFAPSALFKADAALHRPVAVDPMLGLPLSLVAKAAPERSGYVAVSRYRPLWGGTAAGSIGGVMHRVSALERFPDASLAIEAVTGPDGAVRYIVELPGIRHLGAAADPQDLSGAVNAMEMRSTAYTRCVSEALDAAGAPEGAEVMLVGHSQGGIVAMDLAGDPAFNGGRVKVTDVIAAGSPISAKQVVAGSGTAVFSVENVADVVSHLDVVDSASAPETTARLTYQFAEDQQGIGANHSATLYADKLDALANSPNPLFHDFKDRVAPYVTGRTTTAVFTISDAPPS
ncbi:MAG: hypothetical protein ACRDV3_09050 [Acidothermaceae bacterium]